MWNRRHVGAPRVRRMFAAVVLTLFAGCASSPAMQPDTAPRVPPPVLAALWTSLDSMLHTAYPADGPGAAAIVARDGEVLYRGAVGLANLELGTPMRPDMVFNLFSVSKQFTGAGILMLAEEGKLSLSDPITRFFPDYPLGGRTVTVEHLLAHTSGMVNYSDLPAWFPTLRHHVTPDQLIALFRDEPFRFEPGERWEYNNSGYVLLGRIIELQSGMSYGDFMRRRIFDPLGMASSHVYDAPDAIIPRRVAGYTGGESGWRNAEYFSLTHGFGVGNLLSSVDDLARWDAAIDRGELLSPNSWQRAQTSFRLNDGTKSRYGAGWSIGRLGPLETAEHGGNLVGGMTHVLRVPGERLFVAVLANSQPSPVHPEQLAVSMAASVLGVAVDPPEVPLTAGQLDEYVGVYRIDDAATRTVTREGGRLYAQRSGGQRFAIVPIDRDLFAYPSIGMWVRFDRENGRVAAMVMMPRLDAESAPARKID